MVAPLVIVIVIIVPITSLPCRATLTFAPPTRPSLLPADLFVQQRCCPTQEMIVLGTVLL